MVVDEIDDLPMLRRKSAQTLTQRRTGIFLRRRHFGIVGRILDRLGSLVLQLEVLPAPQRREGLETRNRQEPGGNGGSAFEFAGLTPDIEEDLADEIFRDLFVADEPKAEAKHPDMVPSIQHLHGEPVALRDPGDQDFVRSRLWCAQGPSRRICRMGLPGGSIAMPRIFNMPWPRECMCDLPHELASARGNTLRNGKLHRKNGIMVIILLPDHARPRWMAA